MDKVKKVLNAIKNWIVGNGIEGAAGLGVGAVSYTHLTLPTKA